jgi:3-hydroxyisobutyrate dehydrogenase
MKVAFLGTGLLGLPMAQKVLEANHQLFVFNRTIAKTKILEEAGATVFTTGRAAIKKANCVILVLSDYNAIAQVLFKDDQIDLSKKTIIQMGTISPSESIELQKRVYSVGGEYLECPVLGSKKEASLSNLILMVGATQERFKTWKEFLSMFGASVRLIGDVGKAAALKLALNHLIAAHAINFSLSLGIVEKNGVDVDDFMDILRTSSLYAPMFDKKLDNCLKRNYDNPNFPAKHLLKDVNLILKEAEEKNLFLDCARTMKQVLLNTLDRGMGEKDYSSVFNVINKI